MNETAHIGSESKDGVALFGFWLYLLSDAIIFACLFATYAVLHANTFGGPGARDIVSLPYVLAETFVLLTSSFTAGLGVLAAYRGRAHAVLGWFSLTLLLGLSFLALELNEFAALVREGHGPSGSGFLSSYFTLVGTHGFHVAVGSFWMLFMLISVYKRSLTPTNVRRLTMLSLFWHFLDVIWIFIFTLVYLLPFV
jgi:cytochrome o ubiquinol oxidase subunit 3